MAPQTKQCMACGEKESQSKKLLRCSRCKDSYYCSAKCQRKFWPIHKQYCKQLISDDYKITPRSSRSAEFARGETREADVRIDSNGNHICCFTPKRETDSRTFMYLLIQNAHVDVRGKYGFDPFTEEGQARLATCPLETNYPTDDVPQLIMASILPSLASFERPSDVAGVMVVSEEGDGKYYMMMKHGQEYIKNTRISQFNRAECQRGSPSQMSSVVKVKFCMGNSNIKMRQFFREPLKCKVLHAKNEKTIAELKKHLEKNATATDEVIQCPMRGSSRVYEGYLDMQNLGPDNC